MTPLSPRQPQPPHSPRPSLDQVLTKAHRRVACIAVALAGLALTVAGLGALRFYSEQNLRLVARSLSYTVEAAVVFDDAQAAQEALALIGGHEDVAELEVGNSDGRVLARWSPGAPGARARLEQTLAGWLIPSPLLFPVLHDGQAVGQIRLLPLGRGLLQYLLSGLACVGLCLAISIAVAARLARRMQAEITGPLRDLAGVAHRVRCDRSFGLRVPDAGIAELNALNGDFNALLDELEAWQRHQQKEHATLSHRASHDSLTGLSNRALLESELAKALAEAAADQGLVALLYLDSDRFKEINDQHGHAAGDAVLVNIAARIKTLLRSNDLVARLGGDEFAILLRPLRHGADALAIADQIIAAMAQPIHLPSGDDIYTSLSIGVALYPQHGADPAAMLLAADEAMYQAKQQRRGSRQLAAPAPTILG